jgi:DNA-binding transcriptional ArsR family regulator
VPSWVVANTSANRILKTQEDAPGGVPQVVTGGSGLDDDENARMIGDCVYVDSRGKEEVRDAVLNTYWRLVDIKAESAGRLAESGEPGTTTIISAAAFKRCRQIMPHTNYGSAREIARTKARIPIGKRTKGIVDAVSYAFGYGTRVEALAILAEGTISVTEVASATGVSLTSLSDHIRYLKEYGCIEAVGTGAARNTNKHFYRAVTLPRISPEEYRVMSPAERRDVSGLIIQGTIVETLAAFRHRKLEADEKVRLIWDCLNLDKRGGRDVATCFDEEYERLLEIKDRNARRLERSGEQGVPMVISLGGFERSRPGRPHTGYSSHTEI